MGVPSRSVSVHNSLSSGGRAILRYQPTSIHTQHAAPSVRLSDLRCITQQSSCCGSTWQVSSTGRGCPGIGIIEIAVQPVRATAVAAVGLRNGFSAWPVVVTALTEQVVVAAG